MVQNNQTSVWYRFRLRSQVTLTGLKHQNEPNKVAAQQLIQIYIIVQNEHKNKFTSSIDSIFDEIYTSWGTSRMARDPREMVWQGTTYNKFNTICAILPATLLYKQFHKTFHSKRCQDFAFHLMIVANLKGKIQIKSRYEK